MEHAPTPPAQTHFSGAELEALHLEDRTAARNIVGLMAAIFIAGLIGYLGIAYWVS